MCWRQPEAHVDDALCGAHVILQLRTALKIVHSLWANRRVGHGKMQRELVRDWHGKQGCEEK